MLIFKDKKSICKSPSPSEKEEKANLLNESSVLSTITTVNQPELKIKDSAESVSAAVPGIPVDFTGQYELYSSENFDEFLIELGLGYFKRLAATRASSVYFITRNEDKYTLKTVSTFGETMTTFKSGEPFIEDRLDGSRVTSTITVIGNKWIQKQVGGESGEVTIIREWIFPSSNQPEIEVTSFINGITTIRKYKKIG